MYLKHFIFVLALLALFAPAGVWAEFGIDQYSAVSFDQDGQALVISKFTWQNFGNENLDHFTCEISGQNSRLINAIQEIEEISKVCLAWHDSCLRTDQTGVCIQYQRACDNWQENESGQRSYRYSSLLADVERKENSILYSFAFDQPVEPARQATVIISYRVDDYVKKNLGLYRFNFPTPKIAFPTSSTRLAFDAEEPFKLAGARQTPHFYKKVMDVFTPMEIYRSESPVLERISQRLPNLDGLVFEADALAAGTSFEARGGYSSSLFLLYWPEILLAAVIIILIGVILGFLIFSLAKDPKKKRRLEKFFTKDYFQLPVVALFNAGALYLAYYLSRKLTQTRFADANPDSLIVDLVSFAFLIITLAVLFAPSLYIWKKKQAKKAVLLFVMMILLVILTALLSSIILII